MQRSHRNAGNSLYKRRFNPTEDTNSPQMKGTAHMEKLTEKTVHQEASEQYEEAYPLNEQEGNDRTDRKDGYSYQPREEYTHAFPAEDKMSTEGSDLYKELKKFWNDGNPDIIKLGRAKLQYEENIGPGQRHIERFINEIVSSRRFDLASVGSFDKFLANYSPQEMIKAFFEGSTILQTISIRLALSATEKTTDEKMAHPQSAIPSFLRPSTSFAPSFEKSSAYLRLNTANVRRAFWIDVGGDFRNINVTNLMESWRPQKGDIIMNLRSCYRKIFSEITVDPQQIRSYAIRLSNRGRRFPGIKDLPQQIVDTLIDYTLAIFGLDHQEIAEVNENSPLPKTQFVQNLGTTDEDRFERLLFLAGERRNILQRAPRLIQEALLTIPCHISLLMWFRSDIRQSTVEIEQLEDGSCTVNFKNNKRKANLTEVGKIQENYPQNPRKPEEDNM